MFEEYLEETKKEIVSQVCELINIPSTYEKSSNPQKPFGEEMNHALLHTLALGEKLGFRTKNIDGYCGYIEFGEGNDLVGIIGHLDVVPSGDGWNYPPFLATIVNNKIYGRGAIDDKGPVIASLYAMKAVMEKANVKKRVRLILGADEERNWDCITHYKAHEESPTVGFSPDADFPCIYAEKGLLSTYILQDVSSISSQSITIESMDCANNAINVVPKICSCVLKLDTKQISSTDFTLILKELIQQYRYEIDIYQIDDTYLKLTSHGVSAHAAHPDLGVNAITHLLIVLQEVFNRYSVKIDLLDFFYQYLHTDIYGSKIKKNTKDESGNLTVNLGDIFLNKGQLGIGLNLRIPITTRIEDIEECFKDILKKYPTLDLEFTNAKKHLYISKSDSLVRLLNGIYESNTNSKAQPIAIGGATYARAFENCVSFGPNLPGAKDMCHQVDEFITIDNLMLAAKIYADAIYKLAN